MEKLSMNSTVQALWETPVGHDVIEKVLLQLNISEKWITNPIVGRLRLKTLSSLTEKRLGAAFWSALVALVNAETGVPADRIPGAVGSIKPAWWKEAVIYQIYPRSFADANGDGIGDLKGILSKLDYLKSLGVDALWLSPIYDSPNDDNGYDIRDYRKIMTEFGTMEDFNALVAGIHARGMRLIMDLVVNHTSDEHVWFQTALADPTSKYRDYYFFRKGKNGREPNNWNSFFGGSAWNHYPEQDAWALHLFSKKQMDLNWDNPAVRADVIDMINWWLDRGVDGFRMDVINYISKAEGLPDGNETIGKMMLFYGIEHYYYGPHLHEYLHEIQEKAFRPHGAFSVGETPGVGREMAKLLTGEERGELDMVFSFDQLETPGHIRFDDYEYDLNYYRDYITDWMEHYGNNCWMSLFYNNHDNPRMVSKVSQNPAYRRPIATLLAVMQFTLKGTPFVFQGDEMGLVNYDFHSITELSDVESRNRYAELLEQCSPEKAFAIIKAGTRDHSRVLLPWNEKARQLPAHLMQEPDQTITALYKRLIALRKAHPALIYGDFTLLSRKKNTFVYRRSLAEETFVIECNLAAKPRKPVFRANGYTRIEPAAVTDRMQPYEARIYRKSNSEQDRS